MIEKIEAVAALLASVTFLILLVLTALATVSFAVACAVQVVRGRRERRALLDFVAGKSVRR